MATETLAESAAPSLTDRPLLDLLVGVVIVGLVAGVIGSLTISRLSMPDAPLTGAIAGLSFAAIYVFILIGLSR